MRTRLAIAAALLLASGTAFADPVYPPPPLPAADCAAGASITGYPSVGAVLGAGGHCGTPVASGTINLSTVGQLGEYSGTATITGITPGGDVSFTSPNFTVTGIAGTPLGSTTATAGNLLIGSGSQWVTRVLGGDAAISSLGAVTINSLHAGTITVPSATDTVALLAAPQTLTNKTLSCLNNACTVRANLDLTGQLAAANFPALTGDVTTAGGSLTTTISNGSITAVKLASGAASVNIGSLGGVLLGTLPNPSMATGAAALNVGILGGDLNGTLPNPTVARIQGRPVSAVAPTISQVLSWDGSSWVPGAGGAGSGGPPTGSAHGDLSGNYPNPTVASINGVNLGVTTATAGNILIGDGNQWVSRVVTGDVMFTGAGVATATVQNGSITAPKLAVGAAIANIGTLGGDIGGTLPNPLVTGLQGRPVVSTPPTLNQILSWDGSSWTPATPPVAAITQLTGAVTAGPGSGSQVATIAPSGVAAGNYTVSDGSNPFCWTVAATGQITGVAAGACAGAGTHFVLLDAGGHITLNGGGSLLTNAS